MNPSSSSSSVKKSRSELPDLPVDLIVREIISRLPVDQVLDCQFVCKTWFRVISSSIRLRFFIQNNLPHQLLPYHHFTDHKYYPSSSSSDGGDNTKIGFLIGIEEEEEEEEEDDEYTMFYKEYNDGVISTTKRINHHRLIMARDMFVGSRNGLICIAKYIFGNHILYICNPVTRECLYLPEITSPEYYQVFGFGYNATSKEYKAVRIVYPKTENGVDSGGLVQVYPKTGNGGVNSGGLVQVYTLGGRSGWRDMGTVASYFGPPAPGAFVDGALHWLGGEGKVWALDMADEKFRILTVSRHTGDGSNVHFHQELVVLGGWLSVLEFHPDVVQIWSFKKANADQKLSSWSPVYSIEYDDYLIAFGLTNKGQLLCLNNDNQICLCDAEHIHDLEETPPVFYAMLHVNTFISLRDLGEEGVEVIE